MIDRALKKYYPLEIINLTEDIYYDFQSKRFERCKHRINLLNNDFNKLIDALSLRFAGRLLDETILNPNDPSLRTSIKIKSNKLISVQIVMSLLADYATIIVNLKNDEDRYIHRFMLEEDLSNEDIKYIHDSFLRYSNFRLLTGDKLRNKYKFQSSIFDFKESTLYELLFGSRFLPIEI